MKVFSVPMIIHATAYIRAADADKAFAMASTLGEQTVNWEDNSDIFSGKQFDDPNLPEMSISPAMTIGEPEEHIENVQCVHDDDSGDEPAAAPLSAAEALDRIRARLAGEWFDPSGDVESDISATLRRVQA